MKHFIDRNGPIYAFFHPFYRKARGVILGLATPSDPCRDGPALAHLIRHFPLPGYEGVRMAPGGPGVEQSENVIVIGWSRLFTNPADQGDTGRELPRVSGALRERLTRLDERCCFQFDGDEERAVVNTVTGERFRPEKKAHSILDYGVIRRSFSGPMSNIVTGEGVHRAGTLGTVKAMTSEPCLEAIGNAVNRLEDFDEAVPLEILVRARVDDERQLGVYWLDHVQVEPIQVVCGLRWRCDLQRERVRWVDQLPWDVHIWTAGDGPTRRAGAGPALDRLPRLEIEGDLRDADEELKSLCRRVLLEGGKGNGHREESVLDETIRRLSARADSLRMVLVDKLPFGGDERLQACAPERFRDLPEREGTEVRAVRKQFVAHLALGRFLDRPFHCGEESIRRCFPRFEPLTRGDLAGSFVRRIPGRLWEGFGPLARTRKNPRGPVRFECTRPGRRYSMRLDRTALVLKLRL